MLATPQSQSSYPFHPHRYADLQSPSTTTARLVLADSYQSSALLSQDSEHWQHQHLDHISTSNSYGKPEYYLGHQLMSTPVFSTRTPPIRVHRSSPAPQLSETALSQHEWQSNTGGTQMWSGTGAYRQSGQKHQRTSSGSSIGSGGPSSPYNATTSHPHILQSEASPAGLQAYPSYDFSDPSDSTAFSKSYEDQQDSFLAPAFQNFDPATQDAESNVAAKLAMMQALKFQQRSSDSPAPTDFSISNRQSVSSRGQTSPKTSQTKMHNGFQYQNGLYNTSYSQAGQAVSQQAPSNAMLSPYRNVFSERIQAANNSHMNVAPHSPVSSISRERSPFRRGSPYAAPIDSIGPSPAHLSSAAQVRERQKAEEDAMALQQHQYRTEEEMRTPKTISPKDAVLEFHESEEDSKMPLFPSEESMDRAFEGLPSFRRQSSNFNFTPASIPAQVQVPQQYPFISQQRRQNSSFRSRAEGTPEFPAHLTSMESSASESNAESVVTEVPKPAQTSADSGTYTCTYHGCTLRFESPAKLQKHKREGHRQSTPSQASYGASGLSPAALRNSQAGPHRCDRINPQTGKPCSTIFSRPYDLTRHEDTIHNARKRKVRCQYCVEDKTFSRNDALTRHMRVVHPEIEFSGKSKKHDD